MRVYDKDFKEEAVKLSYEVGPTAAAKKLGIPVTTLYTWRNNANRYMLFWLKSIRFVQTTRTMELTEFICNYGFFTAIKAVTI